MAEIMIRKLLLLFFLLFVSSIFSQSVARKWNEEILHAIRNDFARPTVHARNLFHSSVVMYDMWAVFDGLADTFFLGKMLVDLIALLRVLQPTSQRWLLRKKR